MKKQLYLIWLLCNEIPFAFIEADSPQQAALDFAFETTLSLVDFRVMDCEAYCNIVNQQLLGH